MMFLFSFHHIATTLQFTAVITAGCNKKVLFEIIDSRFKLIKFFFLMKSVLIIK